MARLLILGGSGFIGRQICQFALSQGHEVVSVTRRGAPGRAEAWAETVTWVAADIFKPEQWRAHLATCDAAVHALGLRKERPAQGLTFGHILADSAVLAADEAARAGVSTYVFISAEVTPPGFDPSFLEAKRRAEREIASKRLRSVLLRPSLVYGSSRPLTVLAGRAFELAERLPVLSLGPRPISTATLARAVVNAAQHGEVFGVQSVRDIRALAA